MSVVTAPLVPKPIAKPSPTHIVTLTLTLPLALTLTHMQLFHNARVFKHAVTCSASCWPRGLMTSSLKRWACGSACSAMAAAAGISFVSTISRANGSACKTDECRPSSLCYR